MPAPRNWQAEDAEYRNSVTYPDGTVITTSPGGGAPDWQRHGTLSFNSETSVTYTFSQTWESVMLIGESSGTNDWLDLRVNGDTGTNYDYHDATGTGTSSASEIQHVGLAGRMGGFFVTMTGNWTNYFGMGAMGVGNNTHTMTGRNISAAAPLTQFTLFTSGGTTTSIDIGVFVR